MNVKVRRKGMSLKHALTFQALACGCVVSCQAVWDVIGPPACLFLYIGLSFLLIAIAYAGAGPGLLMKKRTGCKSIWSWLFFGPYFLLNVLTFALYRLLSGEGAYVQVAPNLFFGRWLSAHEAANGRWASVLDLAAEFSAPRPFRKLAGYRSLPVLDATAPTAAELISCTIWIANALSCGPVYVHCALGHGRSACVVIAYLLSVGEVSSVGEGLRRLQSLRPGVGLHPIQRQRLRSFEPSRTRSVRQ